MKRKTIVISVLVVLVCVAFYFVHKQYSTDNQVAEPRVFIENQVLRDIALHDNLPNCVNELCRKYKIPVVLEGHDNYSTYAHKKTKTYSAKEITVRQLLDTIVPKDDFIMEKHGNIMHIISKAVASRPDYQMNTVIERFSARNVDRNTLIKSAVAQAGKNNASEPLVYAEFPHKRFKIKFDPPKISIDMKHATLREILDRISQKADFCYSVERGVNADVSFSSYVPVGSYAQWITIWSDWFFPFPDEQVQQSSGTASASPVISDKK